jgi:endonuclease/exonuclease/phosphatase family metal-dependent hydrolase
MWTAMVIRLPKEGLVRRIIFLLLPVAVIAGGWLFLQNFQIEGLEGIRITRRSSLPAASAPDLPPPPLLEDGQQTITIASFNIQVFGESKLAKPDVMNVLAQVVRWFDVVAIQEIRAKNQQVIPRFVELINAEGAHYKHVVGPRIGRTVSKEQYAFIYNSATVELIPESVYTVDDPDDLLHREPLVAAFRARGPPPSAAFTFSLVNIHTDPDETDQELDVLDDAFRAVRNDGRGEDDVILLGDLNVDDSHLGELGRMPYVGWVITGMPTNTRGTKMYDNLVFDRRATIEFSGRSGVVDMMRQFNLTMDLAIDVSDHLPIWAEFSVYEGGSAGSVAARPGEPPRR